MNIFISWSGEKSRRVALALKTFLQDVNQRINAWFSEEDITAGQRWANELAAQLENTNYGIICVTQEAIQSQWLIFEAGALSKSVSIGKVCPYLIDFDRRQLIGPLSQFQAKEANKEQTWQLLQSINLSMGNEGLTEERLKKYFETYFPFLLDVITTVNNELKSLPVSLRKKLLDVFPKLYYLRSEIGALATKADISGWKINWSQAAIYIWSDLIQTAVDEKKLKDLLDLIQEDFGMREDVKELHQEIINWEQ